MGKTRGPYANRGRLQIYMQGRRYGRLSVLEHVGFSEYRDSKWRCLCQCGRECIVLGSNLRKGHTTSCGCLAIEVVRERSTVHAHTSNRAPTLTYIAWQSMHTRCAPNYKNAHRYYDRGIVICERWHKFENFLDDMGECPHGMTLDRCNNDGNYEPNNCRWATQTEQQRNRGNNKLTMESANLIRQRLLDGETGAALAVAFNVSRSMISAIKHGRNWAIGESLK